MISTIRKPKETISGLQDIIGPTGDTRTDKALRKSQAEIRMLVNLPL